jgi:hypothetical protein
MAAALTLAGCPEEATVEVVDTSEPAADTADIAVAPDTAVDTGPPDTGPVDIGPPTNTAKKISDLNYAPPTAWAAPLKAYIKAGHDKTGHWDFTRAVHDLAVYQGRLYMGYGDATYNVGSATPIAARYFEDPGLNEPKDEFVTAEEEIHRFRQIGDELWIAGVDATEDNWLGNVYFRTPKDPWVKKRTVQNGVHVHDIGMWNGAHYAVGSGAEKEKWLEGSVWGHLWKSTDKCETWEIVSKHWNAEDGDARWVHLLAVKDKLYVFGYARKASAPYEIPSLPNGTYTGTGLPPTVDGLPGSHPLKAANIGGTWPTGDNSGVVMGVNYLQAKPGFAAWRVVGDDVTMIDKIKDQTLIDVHQHKPSGEVLLMTRDGTDDPDTSGSKLHTIRVWRTEDFVAFDKVLEFPSGELPRSIAWWQGRIYFGATEGQIWRSLATWK